MITIMHEFWNSCIDRDDEAVLPRTVQAHPLHHPRVGLYEWQDTPDGKQPHYFTRTDGQVISFAGLWDEWKDRASGETVKSCTMIITGPNAMVAEVHDRMPVVLEPDQFHAMA